MAKWSYVKRSKMAGLPPGTLIHVGEQKIDKAVLSLIDYDETSLEERTLGDVEEALPFKDRPSVTWLDVTGLHQVDIIEKIGRHFNLHPLIQEDILNAGQRPKVEDFEEYLYIVLRMVYKPESQNGIVSEQISLVLGRNFVISFQEAQGDVFNMVRERIRKARGNIRKKGADYLAYALLDAVVDGYFSILEDFGEKVESLEEEVVASASTETLKGIHSLKANLIMLRKSVWPLREVVNNLQHGDSSLMAEDTVVYIRNVHDHTIQIIDTIETFRDMVSGLLDIYLSSISNRMNEVMKVLTIIATIFIPLTFMAGIYGMNFEYMPELKFHYGYPLLWLAMTIVGGIMVIYFKKKKWL